MCCVRASAFALMQFFTLMNSRYRRALSNNCTEGSLLKYSPRRQKCPSLAPRGLQLFTSEGTLVATLGRNVTFLVFLEEVLTSPEQRHYRVHYRVILSFLKFTVNQDAARDGGVADKYGVT